MAQSYHIINSVEYTVDGLLAELADLGERGWKFGLSVGPLIVMYSDDVAKYSSSSSTSKSVSSSSSSTSSSSYSRSLSLFAIGWWLAAAFGIAVAAATEWSVLTLRRGGTTSSS